MKSCLYEGIVRHRRLSPRSHEFQYRVFMPYLCLQELPELFENKRFWSATGPALAQFRRSDFLGDPDLPLDCEVRRYNWRSNTPDRRLVLHMENLSEGNKVFDATLSMSAQPMTAKNLNKLLLRHPFITMKVGLAIYWQALRLYLKGVPVYQHPQNNSV